MKTKVKIINEVQIKTKTFKTWASMSKNIIILQHIDIETPGYILDLMHQDNYNLTTIELDEGEK